MQSLEWTGATLLHAFHNFLVNYRPLQHMENVKHVGTVILSTTFQT